MQGVTRYLASVRRSPTLPSSARLFGAHASAGLLERGVERETRLELATLTLARYRSNSVFAGGRKWPLNDYLPPISTGIDADHTGRHIDHTAFHADHKTPQPAEMVVDARWTVTGSTRYSPTAAGGTNAPSALHCQPPSENRRQTNPLPKAGRSLEDLARLSGDPEPVDQSQAAGPSARQAAGSHLDERLPGVP